MGSEPPVAVQNRAQHFQAISIQLEVMRDEQSHKTDYRSAHTADPVFVETFKNDAEQHRRPAHKNRRTIEVRHRWSPLQIHSGDQSERVDEKCADEKDHRRPAERLWPYQPRKQSEYQNDDV